MGKSGEESKPEAGWSGDLNQAQLPKEGEKDGAISEASQRVQSKERLNVPIDLDASTNKETPG
jgi:hypothetical protein